MKNNNELIKKILLNMTYNPKKSLVENKLTLGDSLLMEGPGDPPNGQQIPTTMNQIMQFQKYIWGVVEKGLPKVANTCKSADKKSDCAYNSMLCSKKPCWKKDAVDGLWGGNTTKAWETYKTQYKKYNPNWWVDDVKTQLDVTGQQIPVNVLQTKNFQKWYLEQAEKSKPVMDYKTKKYLYTTKLCGSPCTYEQAVDGIFGSEGSRTRKLWDTYKDIYMKSNPNWYRDIDFDQDVVRNQEKMEKIAKTFVFTVGNPSGYNGTSPVTDIPKWMVSNKSTLFKFDEPSATKMYKNYGWDVNPSIFPAPKLYSESDFELFMPEGAKEKISKIEDERRDWYIYLNNNKSDYLGAGGKFEAEQSAMTGIPTRGQQYEEDWSKRLKAATGPQYVGGKEWNQELNLVKGYINEKCKRPLMLTDTRDDDEENPVYISYSDICYYAGGLWVWNAGQGPNAYCGCRFMDRKNGLIGEQAFMLKNKKGEDMTIFIDFKSAMAYQTPGGVKDNEKYETIHNVLTVVELSLLAISFVSGPLAPIFIGLSAIAGVADGAVYYEQGDKYMGTMMIALSLLGVDELVTLAKYGKQTIKTLGKSGIKSLAEKRLSKTVLTETEQLAVKDIEKALYYSQTPINNAMKIKMGTEFINTGIYTTAVNNSWGWDWFFSVIYKLNKINEKAFGLPLMVIKIGGIAYTTDQIYLAIYGNDEDRKYSPFGQLFDYFNNASDDEKNKEATLAFEQLQTEISKKSDTVLKGEVLDQVLKIDLTNVTPMDELEAFYRAKNANLINKPKDKVTPEQEEQQKSHIFTLSPPLGEIEMGESFIMWGMSGESVTSIQTMLKERGYDIIVNGIFDWGTDGSVRKFQHENNLNTSGVVDVATLTILKSETKNYDCNEKIKTLKSSGWVEINKIDYIKRLESPNNLEKTERVECNNIITYLFNSGPQPKQVGQSPILKTIVDNPDLQEIYIKFKKMI